MAKFRYILGLFLTSFLWLEQSCRLKDSKSLFDDIEVQHISTTEPDTIRFKKAYNNIVREIAKNENFANKANVSCFNALRKYASDSELVSLTSHSSPNVRVYAFKALDARNYIGIKHILKAHLGDRQSLYFLEGITEPGGSTTYWMPRYVNLFLLDMAIAKLTLKEYLLYRNICSKSFTSEEWKNIGNIMNIQY